MQTSQKEIQMFSLWKFCGQRVSRIVIYAWAQPTMKQVEDWSKSTSRNFSRLFILRRRIVLQRFSVSSKNKTVKEILLGLDTLRVLALFWMLIQSDIWYISCFWCSIQLKSEKQCNKGKMDLKNFPIYPGNDLFTTNGLIKNCANQHSELENSQEGEMWQKRTKCAHSLSLSIGKKDTHLKFLQKAT